MRAGEPPDAETGSLVRAPLWITVGVPLVAATLLGLVEIQEWDRPLFLSFNALPRFTGPGLWAHVTILGDGLVAAVLLLPWVRRYPERVWGGLLGALVMVLILRLFKDLVSLPRPLAALPEGTINLIGPGHRRGAFPSGHTATFFLWAGVWALSTPRRWLSLALLLPAGLVGISRMAVGVHWPSDVLAGAVLGWGTAWLGLRVAGRWRWGLGARAGRVLGGALMVSAVVLLVIDHTGYPGVLLFQRALAATCLALGGRELLAEGRHSDSSGFPHQEMED